MPMIPKRSRSLRVISVPSLKKAIPVLLCILLSGYQFSFSKLELTNNHGMVEEIHELVDNVDSVDTTNVKTPTTTSDTTTATAPITTMTTKTTTAAESSSLPSCPSFQNSERWLNSTRLSNSDDDMLTHELVQSLIFDVSPLDTIDGSKDILEQSMCVDKSNFLNWDNDVLPSAHQTQTPTDLKEDEQIKHLAVKLIYLAIHEHQHGPARAEAISRYSHNCEEKDGNVSGNESNIRTSTSTMQSGLEKSNIGKFDFECPDTKYIVTNVPRLGFGAALRLGVSEALFKGLTSDRVVLYMNSLPNSLIEHGKLNEPWKLASCPRGDIQCVFMSPSPCVITQDDLSKAPVLSRETLDKYSKTGKFDEEYENEKVLIMTPHLNGHKPPPVGLNEVIVNKITSLYAKKAKEEVHDGDVSAPQETSSSLSLSSTSSLPSTAWDLNDDLLEKVKKFILESNHWLIHDVFLMYLLRPNQTSRKKIDDALHKAIPENFNPKTAIGVPIRGTDKCNRESECMEFDEYPQMIKELAAKRIKMRQNSTESTTESTIPPYDTVMLTSESKEIIEARKAYTPKNESFPFDFIVNEEDVGQGTGNPKFFGRTGDEVLLSTMIALKLQLLPDSLVINRCSNHHAMIQSFVVLGCGQVNHLETLSDNDNPQFRVQCKMSGMRRGKGEYKGPEGGVKVQK